MNIIPTATKPCEVLCFFPVEFATREGDAYLFLSMDVYSEFLIQTGLEKSNDIEYVLKHIGLLLQHRDFTSRKNRVFTLVLHKHEQHRLKIEALIKPHGGTLVIDDPYLYEKMVPVITNLYSNMAQTNVKG